MNLLRTVDVYLSSDNGSSSSDNDAIAFHNYRFTQNLESSRKKTILNIVMVKCMIFL